MVADGYSLQYDYLFKLTFDDYTAVTASSSGKLRIKDPCLLYSAIMSTPTDPIEYEIGSVGVYEYIYVRKSNF